MEIIRGPDETVEAPYFLELARARELARCEEKMAIASAVGPIYRKREEASRKKAAVIIENAAVVKEQNAVLEKKDAEIARLLSLLDKRSGVN
jgi:hypothetical protein